jgi:hypothetical protein
MTSAAGGAGSPPRWRGLAAGSSSRRSTEEIVAAHPASAPVQLIQSPYGHDGFLIEIGAVGSLVREALASTRVSCS